MRLTIIPLDNVVTIDGISFNTIDLSSIPLDVHAIQWYNTIGEVEIKDVETGRMLRNNTIDSISTYQSIIDQFYILKNEADAKQAEITAEETIIEV
jgi:hypothetical protein